VTPAARAVVVVPTVSGGIRYLPEQNMVELVGEPRAANAEVIGTRAMGASAVGQPVRVPQIDAVPLDGGR